MKTIPFAIVLFFLSSATMGQTLPCEFDGACIGESASWFGNTFPTLEGSRYRHVSEGATTYLLRDRMFIDEMWESATATSVGGRFKSFCFEQGFPGRDEALRRYDGCRERLTGLYGPLFIGEKAVKGKGCHALWMEDGRHLDLFLQRERGRRWKVMAVVVESEKKK